MPRPALVICDGALASTVGALLEAERCPPVAWVPPVGAELLPPSGHDHEAILACVRRQADLRGYADVVDAGDAGGLGRLATPIALLEAVRDAIERGCERVVWPVAFGSDLDAMSLTAERALLVTRLAWLDAGSLTSQTPEVETPLLDLTDHALEEMARDLDLADDARLAPRDEATARP